MRAHLHIPNRALERAPQTTNASNLSDDVITQTARSVGDVTTRKLVCLLFLVLYCGGTTVTFIFQLRINVC